MKKDSKKCLKIAKKFKSGKSINFENGKFNIYSYDCDNPEKDEPLKTLDGRYFTYYYDGLIAFVEY